ncbi:Zn-ribbon domain-containing OB-fold protein [Oceaniglobus trochenteri]|uniref:Zn-ribbon domain-containing OB-fold protein n=1 Tax=Oceaniglobus trochenteri TaxID=2763260 RepID=UPI001CFF6C19|nr:OB-fold domain-containing protein [Oceaniglobus trochenteri]
MNDISAIPAGEAADATILPFPDLEEDGAQIEVRDGIVRLVGARSQSSGVAAFPARPVCPETGARDMAPEHFGPDATLYSFSTIHVSATREVPYSLGYIDFPEGLRVLAVVRGESLACDMPVTLRADGDDWWAEARA